MMPQNLGKYSDPGLAAETDMALPGDGRITPTKMEDIALTGPTLGATIQLTLPELG